MEKIRLAKPKFILADDKQKRYTTAPGKPMGIEELASKQAEDKMQRDIDSVPSENPYESLFNKQANIPLDENDPDMEDIMAEQERQNRALTNDEIDMFKSLKARFRGQETGPMDESDVEGMMEPTPEAVNEARRANDANEPVSQGIVDRINAQETGPMNEDDIEQFSSLKNRFRGR